MHLALNPKFFHIPRLACSSHLLMRMPVRLFCESTLIANLFISNKGVMAEEQEIVEINYEEQYRYALLRQVNVSSTNHFFS